MPSKNSAGDSRAHLRVFPELHQSSRGWRFVPAADALKDRTVLITGAGAGIGLTLAKTCALHGANVVLLGKTRARLEAVFDWIGEHTHTRPVIVPCDLAAFADENGQALHDAIADEYGSLDALVHNASVLGSITPIAHYPSSAWENALRVNTSAPFYLTRALLPLMEVTGRHSSLIFTSSGVARQPRAFWGAYAVSKVALEGLCTVLAEELAQTSNVIVTSLNPGGTRTVMRREAYPAEDPNTLPMPEDHMDLYLWLLSAATRTQHGQRFSAREWQGPSQSGDSSAV
ncbi:MAG: YciK family oxidoreductase [Gammaproteobacteria bacterium]|nr:YciK family oxidoreductase [Gammaproteobacteria bacterium]